MATETIQKTIAKIVKSDEKESKGVKSIKIKVADSSLPIIPINGITQ